jgi:magnesium transporter
MEKEFLDHMKELIAQKDSDQLKTALADLHPADIAELCNELDAEEAKFIYLLLDNETAADVLIEMDEDVRKEFLELLPSETIAKRFVDYMDSDDAVDIIREMDEDKQEEVLSHIEDIEQAGDIVDLLKYDEDTAGGLMGTEMVVVNENWSMPECLKEMRIQAEDMDEIYYVYVVDDDERLRGVFPLKKMITSKDPLSVHVDTPIDEVVQTIEKYNLVALPVVDSIGRLVGHITVDDVMDEVREQADRDYQLASGLSQDVETDDNVFRQTTARLPWLLIGMIGGIGNSMILGNFDATFAAHPEMALYIPLIGGTGGNVGTQSSALVVQGLANSSLDAQETWKQVVKESVVAVINASIISMLVYVYNFVRFGPTATVSYSVSLSLFAVVMFASIFGTLVPMTLEKLKIDPAIATGPFISITNDIIGMMLYMGITALLS